MARARVRRVTCDGHTDVFCVVGLARGRWRWGLALPGRAGLMEVSSHAGLAAPRLCGYEHACAGSPVIARGENHINSRLQIKQYLWAIVIKGKFNSVLMPHYVWLCEAQLGLAASSVGPEVTREAENQSPFLAPTSQQGRATIFSSL